MRGVVWAWSRYGDNPARAEMKGRIKMAGRNVLRNIAEKEAKQFKDPRLEELFQRIRILHATKGKDYAGRPGSLDNLSACKKDLNIPAWIGVMFRIGDKYRRLCNFAKVKKFEIPEEGVVTNLLEMSHYALLGVMLYEIEENKKGEIKSEVDETSGGSSTLPL